MDGTASPLWSPPGSRCRASPGTRWLARPGVAWLAPRASWARSSSTSCSNGSPSESVPRLTLDLRTLEDPDDLKTSELHAVGPALQRALRASDRAPRVVAYLVANAAIAGALSDQFKLQSVPALNGAPAQPLLGLALLEDRPIVLGPLPRYLEEVFALVADRGQATAVDLHEAGICRWRRRPTTSASSIACVSPCASARRCRLAAAATCIRSGSSQSSDQQPTAAHRRA